MKEGRYNAEMNLKFICSEDFEIAGEICLKVQGYLPNLISKIEIIGSDVFKGIFETWEIVPMVERVAEPDWQGDIILVVIWGSLYFADIELSEAVGCTLDYLTLQKGKARFRFYVLGVTGKGVAEPIFFTAPVYCRSVHEVLG